MHAPILSPTRNRRLSALLPLTALVIAAVLAAACAGEPTPTPTPEPTSTSTPTATPAPTATPFIASSHTPRPIDLPADEASHDRAVEWWYYSGALQDENDADYGFHFVVFQARDPETGSIGYMAHASVFDVDAGEREQDVRFGLEPQPQPEAGFAFTFSDWMASGGDGTHTFAASTESYAFDLTVEAMKPAALHNEGTGYLEALNGWTYYYSWTSMRVSGTLRVGGNEHDVTGHAWMDHQWGDFVVSGYPSGWQWFSVVMANGHELMVAEAREADGQTVVYGTLIDPEGVTTHIDDEDITIDVLGSWNSPHTGGEYPAGWEIQIPRHEIAMTLTPMLDDQEFTLAFPPNTIYWEGLVETAIIFEGAPLNGSNYGYVELVGYIPPPTT